MDITSVLCGLTETYFRTLPKDVVRYCIAPFLVFAPNASVHPIGQLTANNVKNAHESVEAITHDDNIVIISTRGPSYNGKYMQINMQTQKRTSIRGTAYYRERPIQTITCGAGWINNDGWHREPRMYTYESERPNEVTPCSIEYYGDEDGPNTTRIQVELYEYIDLPGQYIGTSIIDAYRNRVFTCFNDQYLVHVINVATKQLEFRANLRNFLQCKHTSIAKCDKYWIIMEVKSLDSAMQNIDIYDGSARKLTTISVPTPASSCKLMSHPTKPKFATSVPTIDSSQPDFIVTMYEIRDSVSGGVFSALVPDRPMPAAPVAPLRKTRTRRSIAEMAANMYK